MFLATPGRADMGLGQQRRVLAAALACVLVNSAGFYLLVPQLAVAARDPQVNADLMGVLFAASAVVSLVLQLPLGIASDRYGRRGFMPGGTLTTAAALVIRARSNDALALGASQLLYGVAGPLTFSAGLSALADAFPAYRRGTAIGLYQLVQTGGQLAGIGIAAVAAPIGWLGAAYAMLATTTVLALVLAMPDTPFPGRTVATTAILSSMLRFLYGADAVALSLLVTARPAGRAGASWCDRSSPAREAHPLPQPQPRLPPAT